MSKTVIFDLVIYTCGAIAGAMLGYACTKLKTSIETRKQAMRIAELTIRNGQLAQHNNAMMASVNGLATVVKRIIPEESHEQAALDRAMTALEKCIEENTEFVLDGAMTKLQIPKAVKDHPNSTRS